MMKVHVPSDLGKFGLNFLQHCIIWMVFGGFVSGNPLLYKGNKTISFDDGKRDNVLKIPKPYFPYYGRLYDKIFISEDGMVGFQAEVSFEDKVLRENDVRPETTLDVPFIAPYRFNASRNSGRVFSREDFTPAESEYLGRYVEDSVLEIQHFRPSWILVVTWDRVEYESHTNTVQLVLLTDHLKSFAMFNYGDMNIPLRKTFQCGFNGGFGQGWIEAIPFNKLPYAHQSTGSDVMGRYIFQVNDNAVKRGGCVNYRDNFGPLSMSPSYAGMLGGKMLNISGPCLKPSDKIICKFGHDEALAVTSPGFIISTTRASCPVPRLLQRGRVKLSMSIDNGETYYYSSYIYIVHPLDDQQGVYTSSKEVDSLTTDTISVRWNASDLTHHLDALVDIQLIGYFENTNWGVWSVITKVAEDVLVTRGNLTFRVADFPCIGSDCTRFDVGFLEVKIQDVKLAGTRRSINSKVFPLTWFKHKALTTSFGTNWPSRKCNDWYELDEANIRWYREIADCPCTLGQALVDITGWVPDRHCNVFRDTSCSRHQGAVHCVESVLKTFFDAANRCCYSKNGLLMHTTDYGSYGSRPMRSDIGGTPPYINSGIVPYMSYLLSDEMPRKYCCEWSSENDCRKYTTLRPTTDCVSYRPNYIAFLYGQGHYIDFNNKSRRICSRGDYVLVQAPGVVIQGRYQQNFFNTTKDHKVNDSVILTNIGIRYDSASIELRLKRTMEIRTARVLDIIVNKELIRFNGHSPQRQDISRKVEIQGVQNIFSTLMDNSTFPGNTTDSCPSLTDAYFKNIEVCQGNIQCIVDLRSTRNLTLATSTLAFHRLTSYIQNFARKAQTCSPFHVDNSIKDSKNYTVGSSITITGCKTGYIINEGRHTYICKPVAENQQVWSPELQTKCFPEADVRALLLSMAGFTIGIFASMSLCGAIVLFVVVRRRRLRLITRRRENG